jgi:hypothetical protein
MRDAIPERNAGEIIYGGKLRIINAMQSTGGKSVPPFDV